MGDILKSIPIVGVYTTLAGATSLTDNHGNAVKGKTLTCAGKEPTTLSSKETATMYSDIEFPNDIATAFDLRFDGEIPMAEGAESPLNTACRKLHPGKPSKTR
jgi:hypothetical protein